MRLSVFFILVLIGVAGCVTERDRFSLEATNAVCSSDPLPKARAEVNQQTNSWRRSIAQVQNRTGKNATAEVQSSLALIEGYEAEIEVGYQAIRSSCALLSRCMEANGYDTRLCEGPAEQYDRSQDRFAELLAYGRKLDKEIDERIRIINTINVNEKKAQSKEEEKEDKTAQTEDCPGWGQFRSC